jgi:hypothetical protein
MIMHATRRSLLRGALAAAATTLVPNMAALGQAATPVADEPPIPGYGIARFRIHGSADLAQAVYPDVMNRFLPATAAVPGYTGYIFAFDDADSSASINITLLADEASAEAANVVAQEYVQGMDPRLNPETPLAETGAVRIYQITDRTSADLPPFLHGCHMTMRHRLNAPDTDIEAVIASAADGFGPIVREMDGFVLYCWMHAEGGRVSFNVWETAEQLEAGNQAVADYVAANPVITTEGATVVHNGVIAYSDIFRRS